MVKNKILLFFGLVFVGSLISCDHTMIEQSYPYSGEVVRVFSLERGYPFLKSGSEKQLPKLKVIAHDMYEKNAGNFMMTSELIYLPLSTSGIECMVKQKANLMVGLSLLEHGSCAEPSSNLATMLILQGICRDDLPKCGEYHRTLDSGTVCTYSMYDDRSNVARVTLKSTIPENVFELLRSRPKHGLFSSDDIELLRL